MAMCTSRSSTRRLRPSSWKGPPSSGLGLGRPLLGELLLERSRASSPTHTPTPPLPLPGRAAHQTRPLTPTASRGSTSLANPTNPFASTRQQSSLAPRPYALTEFDTPGTRIPGRTHCRIPGTEGHVPSALVSRLGGSEEFGRSDQRVLVWFGGDPVGGCCMSAPSSTNSSICCARKRRSTSVAARWAARS